MIKKIKILHFMTSLSAGGAETNLLSLLNHFNRDEYEHAVAFGGSNNALEAEFDSLNVKLIRLSSRPLGFQALTNTKEILSKVKEYSPDIIHSHLDLANIFSLLAKKMIGCRLVLHFHGLGIVPYKLLPNRSSSHLLWNFLAKTYRYCDKAIAICDFQLPFLKDLGFLENQIVMIPNGISLNTAIPETTGSSGGYKFVNVGRFQPQKDHRMLIQAFKLVVEQNPESRLVLVGDGPLKSEIEDLSVTLGLDKKVEFLGVRRDIPEILAKSDCFVLGSRWELHPITILEAMRAGLPVIASNVGGIADTVDDDVTGILIEAENVDSLANAMLLLAMNVKRGKIMGFEGIKRVKKCFDNDIVARQIEGIYKVISGDI